MTVTLHVMFKHTLHVYVYDNSTRAMMTVTLHVMFKHTLHVYVYDIVLVP